MRGTKTLNRHKNSTVRVIGEDGIQLSLRRTIVWTRCDALATDVSNEVQFAVQVRE